ncbi:MULTISPECIES: YbaK/EbsC family protein [Pseudomonas]|uniref:YbaK/EbsC family protein n=1 Tax=Pseudomonas sp. Hg7Tf TaxID=3236988 RepID=A0AB39I370_9PSED|nr:MULTISPECIES: YbaK/EbsC family protein [Pseudomonas]MDD1976046.1 YbaK/EbsC family protein [Pseudomonas putida]MDH2561962.1 YbaK/EbsC family protein [Pseudomonas sp. Hg5Tf]QYX49100.1 YbaK/EbsC family protein [Pseudomonas sp. S11A 273]
MSLASVKAFFAQHATDIPVLELETSTATVALAAEVLGVEPGQIAKTLSLRVGDDVILLVARGDARLDNRKFKQHFGVKARMLDASQVEEQTGHPVGGVCPFGLVRPLQVFCDVSLKDFASVYPAAGAPNSAVCIEPERMAALVNAHWVDVAEGVRASAAEIV